MIERWSMWAITLVISLAGMGFIYAKDSFESAVICGIAMIYAEIRHPIHASRGTDGRESSNE